MQKLAHGVNGAGGSVRKLFGEAGPRASARRLHDSLLSPAYDKHFDVQVYTNAYIMPWCLGCSLVIRNCILKIVFKLIA